MTCDDAASLTGLLHDYGGLWMITRTPRGFTAQRRPRPAPPDVFTAATVAALRELLEHGDDTGKLAAELGARGFESRFIAAEGRRPSLTVTNPQATALSENVVVGEGWLWWSWAERIAVVTDVAAAVDAISRVLATGSGGGRP